MNPQPFEAMTRDDIIDLLSVVTGGDNRNATEATVAVWTEVAKQGRWTKREAIDAVIGHFAESTEYLMPAHITQRIRAARRTESEVFRALPGPARASEETRASAMAAAAELFAREPRFKRAFAMPWTARGRARSASARAEAERALEAVRPQLDRLIGREP